MTTTTGTGTGRRSRTRFAVLAVVASLALLAGACSGGDDDATAGGEATAGTSAAEAQDEGEGEGGGEGEAMAELPPLPERFVGHDSAVYGELENWICHPDRSDDACDIDLDTTLVRADGSTEVLEVQVDPDAPVDCFYVYPTVNPGPGPVDTAMAADTFAEEGVVEAQLAQLGQVCRIYAPLYRQLTFEGIGGAGGGDELREQAYTDVADAFAHYMANHNDGRPVVLYGHSQGSGMLARLVADEFDGDEAMTARLVSALLIGGSITTAEGSPVGGSFQDVPVCATATSTGCVVGMSTLAPGASEQMLTSWGSARAPWGGEGDGAGLRKVCANPAGLDVSSAELHTIVSASAADAGVTGPLVQDTPYVAMEGAVVAGCVDIGAARILEATLNEAGGWAPEGLEQLTTNVDFWGLHIVEVNLVLGDLVELVRTQTEAFAG